MTEETRRSIFRYGIAVDLVILATGVGMLLPVSPRALIVTFVAAVALTVWKARWKAGMVALALSFLALALIFPEETDAGHLVAFTGAALAAGSIIAASNIARRPVLQPVVVERSNVVAFTTPPGEEELAKEAQERQRIARTLEQAAAAQLEEFRREAERARLEAIEAAAREREAAAREVQERLAEEQRRAAEESARRALEEERLAQEALELERIARQREEDERAAEERRRAAESQDAAELERLARQREEDERAAEERRRAEAELEARLAAERAEAERIAREQAEQFAEERRRAEEELAARLAAERAEAERHAQAQAQKFVEEQRRVQEELEARLTAERAEAERLAHEEAQRQLEAQLIREREEAQRAMQERIEAERRAAEQELHQRLEAEREALRVRMEQQLAAEREAIEREAAARVEAARKAAEDEASRRVAAETPKKAAAKPAPQKPSILATIGESISGLFARSSRPKTVNLKRKSVATNGMPVRKPTAPAPVRRSTASIKPERKPRLLMVERRRATADNAAPKLKQRGIEVSVVERWVDAVDEIFRSRPDAIVIDAEHPEFDKIHRTITDKNNDLPIILSGRAAGAAPQGVRRAAFVVRPYDADELANLAQKAATRPTDLLAEEATPRVAPRPASQPRPIPVAPPDPKPAPAPQPQPQQHVVKPIPLSPMTPPAPAPVPVAAKDPNSDNYEVVCFTCRAPYDAVDADWCSCLAKERSLVCTNCLTCFCKAPPAYKEKFWVEAPPRLFERKTSEARRQQSVLPANAAVEEVTRPLVLTVEDDEEIQAIVGRVCQNLGYGFVYAMNGQDGLEMARAYRPNLILSDAFMPKLDGREMCRILKEEDGFDAKMVVMTGLYTDTKYRSEALKRFHVDDYISKPVAITDLVNLLQKHLEGVTGLPMQEDLHELHRQEVESQPEEEEEDGIALSEILDAPQLFEMRPKPTLVPPPAAKKADTYEVCCFNCQNVFDATRAEWCTCVGRDQTVVCTHCSGCFCKAPAPYKERFWMDAPPSLFERKMLGSKRHHGDKANPVPADVKRPLILLVEDDENVQLIVKTVVTTMGFGFVVGANGQEGLSLAREYNPDLILSDAFMPKLDGREMCRLLKEDPATAGSKAIIMTGLYTDRKYRNEALDYFKVDDYVAKPLAVDDLIKLFKKHLPHQDAAAAN